MMFTIVIVLALVSLMGCAGLYFGTPRPRAQETWAIIALAPVFLLIFISIIGAEHG